MFPCSLQLNGSVHVFPADKVLQRVMLENLNLSYLQYEKQCCGCVVRVIYYSPYSICIPHRATYVGFSPEQIHFVSVLQEFSVCVTTIPLINCATSQFQFLRT